MKYKILILVYLFPFAASANIEECVKQFYSREPSAYHLCMSLAEEDNPEAQKIIGDMNYWSWGEAVPKDYKKAVLWYKRAAKQENIEAKYNLGVLYEQGKGVAPDYSKAFKWYLSAAQDGHSGAQLNVANMFSKGAGVKRSYIESFEWYLRAAEQGEPIAQYNLANRFAKGLGVEVNLIQAYKWYAISGDRGVEDSIFNRDKIEKNMTKEQIDLSRIEIKNWVPERE